MNTKKEIKKRAKLNLLLWELIAKKLRYQNLGLYNSFHIIIISRNR